MLFDIILYKNLILKIITRSIIASFFLLVKLSNLMSKKEYGRTESNAAAAANKYRTW